MRTEAELQAVHDALDKACITLAKAGWITSVTVVSTMQSGICFALGHESGFDTAFDEIMKQCKELQDVVK